MKNTQKGSTLVWVIVVVIIVVIGAYYYSSTTTVKVSDDGSVVTSQEQNTMNSTQQKSSTLLNACEYFTQELADKYLEKKTVLAPREPGDIYNDCVYKIPNDYIQVASLVLTTLSQVGMDNTYELSKNMAKQTSHTSEAVDVSNLGDRAWTSSYTNTNGVNVELNVFKGSTYAKVFTLASTKEKAESIAKNLAAEIVKKLP